MVRAEKNAEIFYTLGGRVELGESDVECLKREIKEEINCQIRDETLEFLVEFQDVAHDCENTLINIKLYKGEIVGVPCASSEIVEICYVDSSMDRKNLTTTGIIFLTWLRENKYIN